MANGGGERERTPAGFQDDAFDAGNEGAASGKAPCRCRMWYWWPFAFVAAGMFLALVASFVVAVVGRSANRELTEFMISTAFCAHGWPFLVVEKVGRRFLGPVLAWMMVFLLAAAQWAALLGGAWHVIHRRRTPMRGRAALWLALAMFAAAGSGMAVWFIT